MFDDLDEQTILITFRTGPGSVTVFEAKVKEGESPEWVADKMMRHAYPFIDQGND